MCVADEFRPQKEFLPKRTFTSLFKWLCQVSCFKSAITNIIGHFLLFTALFSRKETSIPLYLFNKDSRKAENRSDYIQNIFKDTTFFLALPTSTYLVNGDTCMKNLVS